MGIEHETSDSLRFYQPTKTNMCKRKIIFIWSAKFLTFFTMKIWKCVELEQKKVRMSPKSRVWRHFFLGPWKTLKRTHFWAHLTYTQYSFLHAPLSNSRHSFFAPSTNSRQYHFSITSTLEDWEKKVNRILITAPREHPESIYRQPYVPRLYSHLRPSNRPGNLPAYICPHALCRHAPT